MQAVRLSFERAKRHSFPERFYESFLAAHPAIRAKFQRTDFDRQRELLVHGVYSMLDYAERTAMGRLALERLARLHSPGQLSIAPWMYRHWLDAFVATLWEVEPEMTDELALAWKDALRPGIQLMIDVYRSSGEGDRARARR